MIVYNVTVNVENAIHEEWVNWMKDEHIPEVLATGMFVSANMLCLLQPAPEEGHTYAIQYRCADIAAYERYQQEFAPALQAKTKAKFGEKFFAFRTVLQEVL